MSPTSVEQILSISSNVEVSRGKDFIVEGKTNALEYFVEEGICRSYLYDPEGEAITISFFMPGSVISPNTIRTFEGKSLLNLQALTDVKLSVLPAPDFEQLMIDNLEIRHFANTVLQQELIRKVDKEIGLASLTAKERLEKLRKDFPNLENLIPHSDIASYLGITNISLSRLRKEMAS